MRAGIPVVICFSLLFGCADSGEPEVEPPFGGKFDSLEPANIPDLAPTYAVQVVSEVDICLEDDGECEDAPETMVGESIAVLEVTQDGAATTGSITLCKVQMETAEGTRYGDDDDRIADNFLSRVEPMQFQGELVGVEGGIGWVIEPSSLSLGATASLRSVDLDGDGKDGFTLSPAIGRVFMGAHVSATFQVVNTAQPGHFEGKADFDVEYKVFGDTIPLINVGKKIDKAINSRLFPRVRHRISLSPVDGDCAALLAQ